MREKPEGILGRDEIEVFDSEEKKMVKKVVPVILYYGQPMEQRKEYTLFLREWDNPKRGMNKINKMFQH